MSSYNMFEKRKEKNSKDMDVEDEEEWNETEKCSGMKNNGTKWLSWIIIIIKCLWAICCKKGRLTNKGWRLHKNERIYPDRAKSKTRKEIVTETDHFLI